MFARPLPAQGDTPSFRRPDEIPQGPAPCHDVSSGCRAESEVGTLRPLRFCRVVAAGPQALVREDIAGGEGIVESPMGFFFS